MSSPVEMDVVQCVCCTAELTIDPTTQDGEPMCAVCAASFEQYLDSMGMNEPAYLAHLEEMESERREIRSNYNGLGGTVAEHHDHFAGEDA